MGRPSSPERVRVLGLPVDVLTRADLLDRVAQLVRADGASTVAYLNVHVVNEAARDARLRAFLRQVELCYADGQGIVMGAKMLGQHLPERMTGADWIWDFAARAEGEGWRVAWLVDNPGSPSRLAPSSDVATPACSSTPSTASTAPRTCACSSSASPTSPPTSCWWAWAPPPRSTGYRSTAAR